MPYIFNDSADMLLIDLGAYSQITQGTVTHRARKIVIYSKNDVPNAWLKQSEYEMI